MSYQLVRFVLLMFNIKGEVWNFFFPFNGHFEHYLSLILEFKCFVDGYICVCCGLVGQVGQRMCGNLR